MVLREKCYKMASDQPAQKKPRRTEENERPIDEPDFILNPFSENVSRDVHLNLAPNVNESDISLNTLNTQLNVVAKTPTIEQENVRLHQMVHQNGPTTDLSLRNLNNMNIASHNLMSINSTLHSSQNPSHNLSSQNSSNQLPSQNSSNHLQSQNSSNHIPSHNSSSLNSYNSSSHNSSFLNLSYLNSTLSQNILLQSVQNNLSHNIQAGSKNNVNIHNTNKINHLSQNIAEQILPENVQSHITQLSLTHHASVSESPEQVQNYDRGNSYNYIDSERYSTLPNLLQVMGNSPSQTRYSENQNRAEIQNHLENQNLLQSQNGLESQNRIETQTRLEIRNHPGSQIYSVENHSHTENLSHLKENQIHHLENQVHHLGNQGHLENQTLLLEDQSVPVESQTHLLENMAQRIDNHPHHIGNHSHRLESQTHLQNQLFEEDYSSERENDIMNCLVKQCLCSVPEELLYKPFFEVRTSESNGPKTLNLSEWSTKKILRCLSKLQVLFDVYIKQNNKGYICTRIVDICNTIIRNECNLIEQVRILTYNYFMRAKL